MHGTNRRLGLSFLLVLTALCAGCAPEPESINRQHLVFGTLVEITIRATDKDRANEAADRLQAAMRDWHRQWHPWEGGGLARINRRLANGESALAPPQLMDMLNKAAGLYEQTGGRFDPAVGGLVRLWGFADSDNLPQRPPAEAAIRNWRANRPSMSDVELQANRVSTATPLQLDLGGFAKGYALDNAVALLREAGIDHAIINAGGDLRVIGRHGERRWRVGIRAPRGEGILAAVEAADGESIFTSGDYERYFEWQGRRFHHILDPRTGRPARGLQSVTVITGSGARADAAATALFVAGRDWPALARQMGLDQVMAVTDAGGVELTEAMARRITFVGDRPDPVETVAWQ